MKQLKKAIDAGWKVTCWQAAGLWRVHLRRPFDAVGFDDLDGKGPTLGKAIKDALKGDYSA